MVYEVSKWGFEEADEEDLDEAGGPSADKAEHERLTGQDPDEVVTVAVTEAGEIQSVRLVADWKRKVDPRALHVNVLAAVKAATVLALTAQIERAGAPPQDSGVDTLQPQPGPGHARPIVSARDAVRLLSAAREELRQHALRRSEAMRQLVSVDSPGRNVRVSGKAGRVSEVTLHANWAARARASEIESEILSALRKFSAKFPLSKVATRPIGPAVEEVVSLARARQASHDQVMN